MTAPIMGEAPSAACVASFGKLRKGLRRHMQVIVRDTLRYRCIPRRGDARFDAGMFLVCALLHTGPHTGTISRLTGIAHRRCAELGVRARYLGIISRLGVFADPWCDPADELSATINFCMDIMEMTGEVARIGQRGRHDCMYAVVRNA